jgi:hypothetical protein
MQPSIALGGQSSLASISEQRTPGTAHEQRNFLHGFNLYDSITLVVGAMIVSLLFLRKWLGRLGAQGGSSSHGSLLAH